MRSSSSAPTFASLGSASLSKELGKPRSLVVPRGTQRTWSSPALAAAFSLRKYAVDVKHIPPPQRAPRAFQGDPVPIAIEHIDLMGGNGFWRQKLAEEEFKKRKQEEEERRRQDKLKEQERKRREAEQAERRRRHHEEEEKRWLEEREQKQRDQEERERARKEAEAKARRLREEQEEERRRRMPKTCEACSGTGKCQECDGKGHTYSVFLVAQKGRTDFAASASTSMDHGRVLQGCDRCGGYSHNMLGELKNGSGCCPPCYGQGKIWPEIDEPDVFPGRGATKTVTYQMERTGELKIA